MSILPTLLRLQDPTIPTVEGSPALALVVLGVAIFFIASMWIVYAKAGEYGWAVLIPIYGTLVMARVGGKSLVWGILLLVPLIGIIAWLVVAFGIAERFGRSGLFGLGLALLPFIFFPLLAFGDSEASPQMA